MADYALARRNMVENQLRPSRISDERLLEAMANVPRELFLPKSLRNSAYGDGEIDIGDGRTLIEPLALAKLLQAAAPKAGEVALVTGCPTGYTAAVLARLCATVFYLVPIGADTDAVDALMASVGADNVVVQIGDAADGLKRQAPFELIVVPGALSAVPPQLVEQLGDQGRLVTVIASGRAGRVTVLQKAQNGVGRWTPFDAQLPRIRAFDTARGFSF